MRRDRAAEMRQYVGEKEDALWKQNGILVDERKKDSRMGDHRSPKELKTVKFFGRCDYCPK